MARSKDIGKIILGVLGVGAIATAGIASVVSNDNSKKKDENTDDIVPESEQLKQKRV